MAKHNRIQNPETLKKLSALEEHGYLAWDFYANNANDALGILDFTSVDPKEWRFLMVNKGSCELTEYSEEELLEMSPLDIETRKTRKTLKTALARRSSTTGKSLYEEIFVTKSQKKVPVEISTNYITIEDYIFCFAVVRDINKRKELELQMAEHLKNEEKLRKSEQNLRKQLERQVNDMSQFIRSLVHEIKTPLTPIKAAAEELEYQCGKNQNQAALVKQVMSGCDRINRRTGELIDVFKGDLGILKLELQPTEMKDFLEETCLFWDEEAKFNKLSFKHHFAENLPALNIDAERIREVLDNILSNAFKFTPAGGTVSIEAFIKDNQLEIEISDTGNGIKPDQLEHIFDAYYTSKSDGLGLGLYLSKLILNLHYGNIWIENTSPQGTTVKFTLSVINN
ncbi:PAS domain-containing sensor histidine kinase [Dehalococcoides sp. THU3]|uniref:PAS domain-containing sensor histidine kinase n=1 Tax=Dehalococcoides TaxID=61434 RepID=UPI0032188C24